MMKKKLTIGVVAPSFKVPEIEFELGIEQIRRAGFPVEIHPQCLKSHWYFAGTDEERAEAFLEYAWNPKIDIIWYARGGYGAGRLLSILERLTRRRGLPPRKLLVGFSDATAMHAFVKARWGWHTLHAAMPGLRKFCALDPQEWKDTLAFVRRESPKAPWGTGRLKFQGAGPARDVEGELIGGNLSVLVSLIGTPYAMDARDKIVFLEDVDEAVYRVDRMVQQVLDSQVLAGAKAVVLGNFLSCNDPVPLVLSVRPKSAKERDRMIEKPRPSEMERLRKRLKPDLAIRKIFERLTSELGIPLAYGLPVGHGPGKAPLPLGGRYRLARDGRLTLTSWEWMKG